MPTADDVLETAAVAAWPAETVVHDLTGWVLRASGGFTRRANSVAVLGEGPTDLDAAIVAAEAFYTDHELPTRFQVADTPRTERTRSALYEAGYVGDADTVMLSRPHGLLPTNDSSEQVIINDQPSAEWFDLWWSVDGRGERHQDAARELFARMDEPRGFAERAIDGQIVAVQLGVCGADRVGLFCAATAPHARQQGHAATVAQALLRWAAEFETSSSYVQVMADNTASLALSERVGYQRSHNYRYWARPISDA